MLNTIIKKRLPIITQDQTCFDLVDSSSFNCQKSSCKQWIPYEGGKNCVLITTRKGSLTLREIGDIYGLTRMRICQIEKKIYKKIRDHIILAM
jgi:hypothetical protein